jgi:alpha-beta hydrolase superfamily lysophospholipase
MAIKRTEAYFNSSDGEHKIRTLIWQDDKLTPIGIVQLAHGMAEHIERYDDFARFLAANSFIVCGNDHLGHGKSVNDKSELGFFAEKNGNIRLVDDMHILTKIMKKKYPGMPYFLFGHSMGSLCARVYASHFGDELNGVIFCGTAEIPAAASALKPIIDSLIERFGPRTVYEKLGEIFNNFSNISIPEKTSNIDWLSRNVENREKYAADELCGFTFTISGYRDVFALASECSGKDWASVVPLNLPIMMISGALDPVGMNGKGVIAASDNLMLAGKNPTVILYPGDRHEILNEDDKERVYNDVLSWINSIYIS